MLLLALPAAAAKVFVADTGAGVHLACNKPKLETFAGPPVRLLSAGGPLESSLLTAVTLQGLPGSRTAVVLEATPDVLSLGLLVQDEHFHTGKLPDHICLIFVNTNPFFVDHNEVSFEQVVNLAFPVPPGGTDPEFTVSYENAKSVPHHDDLTKGKQVVVKKHGTNFDVAHTNRS